MTAPTARHDAMGNLLHPITATNVPTEADDSNRVDMTDEEKEREAERLFVLFDRLEKSGMGVNPIRKARQEDKFHH
jgi:Guanine nucleotide exchange factor synembryn